MIHIGNITEPMFIPAGSNVLSVDPIYIEYSGYEYSEFKDPDRPAFDFIADRLYPDGSIERSVECTSLPGRETIERVK